MRPSIPQGNRDFGADVLRYRKYITDTIRQVFELYGFEPLETPAMENMETLLGKYGEEGDKLIFKILNNGLDHPAKQENARKDFENILKGRNEKAITERALKYDLTIPFARYVAMNFGKLTLPYKRYQIQPVWRADRPQKGRYREFYQCDADVAGTYSLIADAELSQIYADVFAKLAIPVEIKINNRKILSALAEVCGMPEKLSDITIAIDKLDKIGIDRVKEELLSKGLSDKQVSIIIQYLQISGSNEEKIEQGLQLLGSSDIGRKGFEELTFILNYYKTGHRDQTIVTDFTLARGLDYYTGTIYEVKAAGVQMGSIGGGGRYDDLTGLFGVPGVPGVGISFGLDRIYDVMDELKLFPDKIDTATQVLFFNLGKEESDLAFRVMQDCRQSGIRCEMTYEKSKLDKQFKYATKKNIRFAAIIGSEEMNSNTCLVKNLQNGEQTKVEMRQLVTFLLENK